MTTIKTTEAFMLTEYYYAYTNKQFNTPFLLTESRLPPLIYSTERVQLESSPTEAIYFESPQNIEKNRYVYSNIFSEEACNIVFSTISHSMYKIWLNGLYVGACTGFQLFSFFLSLKKGMNTLVFEIDLINPNYYDFNNRISLEILYFLHRKS